MHVLLFLHLHNIYFYICTQLIIKEAEKQRKMKKVSTLLLCLTMCIGFNSVTFASDVGKSKVPKTNCSIESSINFSPEVATFTLSPNDVAFVPSFESKDLSYLAPVDPKTKCIIALKAPELYWCYSSATIDIFYTISGFNKSKTDAILSGTAGQCSFGILRCYIINPYLHNC